MFGSDAVKTITVRVKGDASDLGKKLNESEGKLKGWQTSAVQAGALAGAAVAGAAVAFGNEALEQAGRADAAIANLAGTLGGPLATALEQSADDFEAIGQSRQDILELEGIFAGIATSLGLTADEVADFAPQVAVAADAIADLTGIDAADAIDKIAKAAQLGEDDLAALGISLTEAEVQSRALETTGKATADALTAGELSAAAYDLILEKLNPKIEQAALLSEGFAGKQDMVNAKFETFTGLVGDFLQEPAEGLLDWFISGIEGWQLFGQAMNSPTDKLRAIFALMDAISRLNPLVPHFDVPGVNAPASSGGFTGQVRTAPGGGGGSVTVRVNDTAPDAQERATTEALRTYNRQNGRETF